MRQSIRIRVLESHLFERFLQQMENFYNLQYVDGLISKEEKDLQLIEIDKEAKLLEFLLVN